MSGFSQKPDLLGMLAHPEEFPRGAFRGGLWRAQVVENNTDPDGRLRVRVRVPQIHGANALTTTGTIDVPAAVPDVHLPWAEVCVPGAATGIGFVSEPPVGAWGWVGFEQGFADRPVWMGGWYGRGDKPSEIADPNLQRIWKTPAGHTILLDDAPAGKITIKHFDGQRTIVLDGNAQKVTIQNGLQSVVMNDAAGTVLVSNGPDQSMLLDRTNQIVKILNGLQQTLMDAALQQIKLSQGTQSIKMDLLAASIAVATALASALLTDAGTVTITAAVTTQVNAPEVLLGTGASKGVTLDDFVKNTYNLHTHIFVAPPNPPLVTTSPDLLGIAGVDYSSNVKAIP